MGWNELFAAIGGFTALVAVAGFIGKFVAEKTADAALKQLESSLKRAEQEQRHALSRIEEEQKSVLKRAEDVQKSIIAFASAIDTDLRNKAHPSLC